MGTPAGKLETDNSKPLDLKKLRFKNVVEPEEPPLLPRTLGKSLLRNMMVRIIPTLKR